MSATVYATAVSRKYHYTQRCYLLTSAQELNDVDCFYCYDMSCGGSHRRIHAIEQMSPHAAALSGKLPCLYCVPPFLRIFTVHDFGHKPINEYTRSDVDRIVCARCMRWTWWADLKIHAGVRVAWPCTSAIVLGLVSKGRSTT